MNCPLLESVEAVGIGWSAIELPLVFRCLASQRICGLSEDSVRAFIATWSHYRDANAAIEWVPFPNYESSDIHFTAEASVLFDDNALTGITLERVRNEMLLRGAESPRIYVTRFSSERRWHHMRMAEHGVVDPECMLNEVKGYIGETPYARSWSTKAGDYTNRIGVFSLARRRILECIHNNSTVEAWDREGF